MESAQYWRNKLKNNKSIDFPSKLCDAMAEITEEFSFAYLKEAFVATLLELARNRDDDDDDDDDEEVYDSEADDGDDPLDRYEFWRAFKAQVKILRREMGEGGNSEDPGPGPEPRPMPDPSDEGIYGVEYEGMMPQFEKMRLQSSSQKTASPQADADMVSGRRFASSARSPIDGFPALAHNKSGGAWEWGV